MGCSLLFALIAKRSAAPSVVIGDKPCHLLGWKSDLLRYVHTPRTARQAMFNDGLNEMLITKRVQRPGASATAWSWLHAYHIVQWPVVGTQERMRGATVRAVYSRQAQHDLLQRVLKTRQMSLHMLPQLALARDSRSGEVCAVAALWEALSGCAGSD